MKPSKEMLERAAASAAEARRVRHPYLDLWLANFATAEVSRAMQECIEAMCDDCRVSWLPRRVERESHGGYVGWDHGQASAVWCMAGPIHELLYQRQLASEGGGEVVSKAKPYWLCRLGLHRWRLQVECTPARTYYKCVRPNCQRGEWEED